MAANTQVIELTNSVNRLTSVIQNLYERMTNQSPEQTLTLPPTLNHGKKLAITNGTNETDEEEETIKPWSNVVTTLDSCDVDSYLSEYLDCEVDKAYLVFKNKTTNKLHTKKAKLTRIYTTLKMCIPDDIEMVSEIKPKNAEKRLKWKLECMEVSKRCAQNAQKIFFDSKCNGNFMKSALHNTKIIKEMKKYLLEKKQRN